MALFLTSSHQVYPSFFNGTPVHGPGLWTFSLMRMSRCTSYAWNWILQLHTEPRSYDGKHLCVFGYEALLSYTLIPHGSSQDQVKILGWKAVTRSWAWKFYQAEDAEMCFPPILILNS